MKAVCSVAFLIAWILTWYHSIAFHGDTSKLISIQWILKIRSIQGIKAITKEMLHNVIIKLETSLNFCILIKGNYFKEHFASLSVEIKT